MATKTWQLKAKGRVLTVKALKAEAHVLNSYLHKLENISGYCREITGIIGGEERTSLIMSIGSSYEIREPETYQMKRTEFYKSLPELITDWKVVAQLALDIFNAHVATVDKRKTPEQAETDNQESQKIHQEVEEKRKAERTEWCSRFCESADEVEIPSGMMAIYLQVVFDDSDSMSDYSHRHASIGHNMLLGIAPDRRSESIARAMVSRYPDLKGLAWTWKKEDYSGGHGYYLEAEHTPDLVFPKQAYNGRKEVKGNYEVCFGSANMRYYPYKGYAEANKTLGAPTESAAGGNGHATMTLNEERNGVELRFPGKPEEGIRNQLKAFGFRWSRPQGLWYARQNEKTLAVAKHMAGLD